MFKRHLDEKNSFKEAVDLTEKNEWVTISSMAKIGKGTPNTVLPLAKREMTRPLKIPPGALLGNKYDLFFFSIVDFSYLFQRPQQLASHFAKRGHRVFYLNISQFVSVKAVKSFRIKEIKRNVYEVFLKGPGPLRVYEDFLESGTLDILYASLEALRKEWGLITCVSVVHNPFWTPLALKMADEYGWKLHYDCMDDWDTFKNVGEPFLVKEKELVKQADLITVTAELLLSRWEKAAKHCSLVPNACDYEHFTQATKGDYLADVKKPIVGFFGGIEYWVDIDLIGFAATQRKDWSFVLLGGVYTDVSAIEKLPNVFLLGSRSYGEMPGYLSRFDVCLIPFKKNKVTEAADPVKLYEYLSSGKPIVARRLDALRQYGDYVYLFDSNEEFVKCIESALNENDSEIRGKRRSLAASNTWGQRIELMEEEVRRLYKKASIILVTHNEGPLFERCIENLMAKTDYPNMEVVLVENRPRRNIRTYLDLLRKRYDRIKPVPGSEKNLARAYGLGIEKSEGDYIVLVNGKTIVTKGWLTKLIHYLDRYPDIGVIGPTLIHDPDDAQNKMPCWREDAADRAAYDSPLSREGHFFDVTAPPEYCIAARRVVVEQVRSLGRGSVRKSTVDDLTKKAIHEGYRVVCAEDVFVHPFRRAGFIIQRGRDMLRTIRYEMRRLLEIGREGVKRMKGTAPSKSSPATDAITGKTKEHRGEESDAWRIGRGVFWLEHELVQQRINEKVSGDPHVNPFQYFVEFLKKGGFTFPFERCLTIGCGAGVVEREVAQHNFCVRHDAFDISEGAIQEAIKAAQADNLTHVHYEVRDINWINLPPAAYDVIFGVSSLHRFAELEHIFEEVNQALKPGGFFFVNEYVGPSRFQWTDRQLEVVNALLKIIPKKYKRNVTAPAIVKEAETRPTVEVVKNTDPCQAVRSEEILPLLNRYFKILEIKHFGGAILPILLTNIAGNFEIEDEEDVRLLKTIFYFEDLLMEYGELPSDFAVIIAEKSRWR